MPVAVAEVRGRLQVRKGELEAFLFTSLVAAVRVVQRFRAPTIDLLTIKKPSETITFPPRSSEAWGRQEISCPTESRSSH
jgi:hypothetical protein